MLTKPETIEYEIGGGKKNEGEKNNLKIESSKPERRRWKFSTWITHHSDGNN